jgi:hypothetical protein
MWNIDPIQIQTTWWKTGKVIYEDRGSVKEGSYELMYFLHKNEYRSCKSVEITIRMGLHYKGEKIDGINQFRL